MTNQCDELLQQMIKHLGAHNESGLLLDVAGTNASLLDKLVNELGAAESLSMLVDACEEKDALLVSSIQGAACLGAARRKVSRVALFYHTLGTGGAERVTLDLAFMLRRMGHEVLLLCDEGLSAGIDLADSGIALVELPDCLSREHDVKRRRPMALYEALRSYKVDLMVYCQWLSPSLGWDLIASKLAGSSFLVFAHGTTRVLMGYGNPEYLRLPSIYRHVDGIVCLSDENARFFETFNGAVYKVVNKVDPAFLDIPAAVHGGHRIGWIGRISYDKSPLEAIDVLSEVLKTVHDAKLVVIGPYGDCSPDTYKEHAEALGVWDSVEIIGEASHDALPRLMQRLDMVLFTSHMEGYPVALAEAMGAGLPCAMYDLSYLTLLEGYHGIVVAPIGDYVSLSDRCKEILTDNEFAQRLGDDARVYLRELQEFDLEAFWTKVLDADSGSAADQSELGAEVACVLYEMGEKQASERARSASLEGQLFEARESVSKMQDALDGIWNSLSLKLGRFITAPVRATRDMAMRFLRR